MAHGDDHVGAGSRAALRAASFRRGFRERSPLVLVAALLLAGLALLGFEALVRSGVFVAVSEGRFLRITHDDYVHVTYRVAELRQDPPVGPTVYLFGGSAAMECFVSEESLAADVSRAADADVGVVSLAAHGQSFAQTIAIVDNLPDGDALLAVGLAPRHFTVAPESDAGLLLDWYGGERSPKPLWELELPSLLAEADAHALLAVRDGQERAFLLYSWRPALGMTELLHLGLSAEAAADDVRPLLVAAGTGAPSDSLLDQGQPVDSRWHRLLLAAGLRETETILEMARDL